MVLYPISQQLGLAMPKQISGNRPIIEPELGPQQAQLHPAAKRRKTGNQLKDRGNLLLSLAYSSDDKSEQEALRQGGEQLLRQGGALEAARPAVLELPATATRDEVARARALQAVKHGDDPFLPAPSSCLPNVFLRSDLFSVNDEHTELKDYPVETPDGMALRYTGERLSQTDKNVYLACLNFYRQIPLAKARGMFAEPITFYKFITEHYGATYGTDTQRVVRDSLLRLNRASMRARVKGADLSVPRMLEVNFYSADGATTGEYLDSSDYMQLCVTSDIAPFFGPENWTILPRKRKHRLPKGLLLWLTDFYASHSAAYALPVKTLYKQSGCASKGRSLGEFRYELKQALTKMQDDKREVRVLEFEYNRESDRIAVRLVGWPEYMGDKKYGLKALTTDTKGT